MLFNTELEDWESGGFRGKAIWSFCDSWQGPIIIYRYGNKVVRRADAGAPYSKVVWERAFGMVRMGAIVGYW